MRKWMYSIDDDMTSQKEAKCTHHAPTRTPTNTARVDAVAKPVRHVSRGLARGRAPPLQRSSSALLRQRKCEGTCLCTQLEAWCPAYLSTGGVASRELDSSLLRSTKRKSVASSVSFRRPLLSCSCVVAPPLTKRRAGPSPPRSCSACHPSRPRSPYTS